MTESAVSIRAVRKSYGAVEALKGVDLEIRPGEVFSILGPNGAGKTTLVEILEGYRSRSGGEATVLGTDPGHPTAAWRARIGVVLQSTAVFDELTVQEVIEEFSRFYPEPLEVGRVIGLVGLDEKRIARCGNLSGGQKRRVDLALGLIGNPELIFLDEPTTGLDPQARHLIWERLKQLLSRGKTIVLTTHFMDEAERLCNRVMVIDHGATIAEDSPAGLITREIEPNVVEVTGEGLAPWAEQARSARLAERIELVGETAFAYCREPAALVASLQQLPGLRYLLRRANLEDVFLKVTGRDLRD